MSPPGAGTAVVPKCTVTSIGKTLCISPHTPLSTASLQALTAVAYGHFHYEYVNTLFKLLVGLLLELQRISIGAVCLFLHFGIDFMSPLTSYTVPLLTVLLLELKLGFAQCNGYK